MIDIPAWIWYGQAYGVQCPRSFAKNLEKSALPRIRNPWAVDANLIVSGKEKTIRMEFADEPVQNEPSQSEPGPVERESRVYPFYFNGTGETLFGIRAINLLLTIATLGIYYFWGKSKVRSYLWSQTGFADERLSWHGTGKELLMGWVKVLILIGVPYFALQNLPLLMGGSEYVLLMGNLASMAVFCAFYPLAVVGARRYRMNRTSLRGIRFSFRGGRWEYAKIVYFKAGLLMMATLGICYPFYQASVQKYMREQSWFGSERFGFDGKAGDLMKPWLIALLLAIPTLFLSLLWYQSRWTRYVWGHTTFGGVRFRSILSFGGLLKLYVVNAVLLVVTLGFASPWVKVRTLRYQMSTLALEGRLDLDAIVQQAQESTAFGEEVGDFMALDFGF